MAKTKLRILDDFGLTPLPGCCRADLLELLDDRFGSGATIVSGQMPAKDWHAFIHDPALADDIMDCLIHSRYKLALKSDFLRKAKAIKSREYSGSLRPSTGSLRPWTVHVLISYLQLTRSVYGSGNAVIAIGRTAGRRAALPCSSLTGLWGIDSHIATAKDTRSDTGGVLQQWSVEALAAITHASLSRTGAIVASLAGHPSDQTRPAAGSAAHGALFFLFQWITLLLHGLKLIVH